MRPSVVHILIATIILLLIYVNADMDYNQNANGAAMRGRPDNFIDMSQNTQFRQGDNCPTLKCPCRDERAPKHYCCGPWQLAHCQLKREVENKAAKRSAKKRMSCPDLKCPCEHEPAPNNYCCGPWQLANCKL